MTLTENVEVQYKCDELYAPECDGGILWNDPSIGIKWPIDVVPVLSAKDETAPLLKDANLNFTY
ncbi:dTDP-4-dehydrorhamnose 3,5-epimerase [compost metagenome]